MYKDDEDICISRYRHLDNAAIPEEATHKARLPASVIHLKRRPAMARDLSADCPETERRHAAGSSRLGPWAFEPGLRTDEVTRECCQVTVVHAIRIPVASRAIVQERFACTARPLKGKVCVIRTMVDCVGDALEGESNGDRPCRPLSYD